MRIKTFVAAGAAAMLSTALLTLPVFASEVPAFSFSSAHFATFDPNTAELGYDFTVGSTPVVVTALGYINDGYNGTHTVEIFDVATQQALPGALATVTTVGGGPSSNTFTYTDLSAPVILAANTQYQIVSQFFTDEYYFVNASGFTQNTDVNLDTAVYDDYGAPPATPAFARYDASGNDPGDFGPNFLTAPTPEPSSLLLLGSGLLGLLGAARRRLA